MKFTTLFSQNKEMMKNEFLSFLDVYHIFKVMCCSKKLYMIIISNQTEFFKVLAETKWGLNIRNINSFQDLACIWVKMESLVSMLCSPPREKNQIRRAWLNRSRLKVKNHSLLDYMSKGYPSIFSLASEKGNPLFKRL